MASASPRRPELSTVENFSPQWVAYSQRTYCVSASAGARVWACTESPSTAYFGSPTAPLSLTPRSMSSLHAANSSKRCCSGVRATLGM